MAQLRPRLNRHSPVALYHQLKKILRSQIITGEYQQKEQLPSENELMQEFDVSQHVVRQALKALVAEGHIVAYQGSRYFVNQERIRKPLPRLGNHTKSMQKLDHETSTLVARKEI